MKRSLIFLPLLLSVMSIFAQNTNPYLIFGYDSEIEYKLPMNKLFRIHNTDTASEMKIIAIDFESSLAYILGEYDVILDTIRVTPNDVLIWLGVDPLSDKYPSQTPYSYVGNRPIIVIDPNGMDEWELNTVTGKFTRVGDRGGSEKDYYNISRPNEKGIFEVTQTSMIDRSDGTINSFRITETEKSTTSAFHIPDADISGFFLEPRGPSTEKSGQNQRIPEGKYHLDRHNSESFPNTFLVSNGKVSESRGILIHSGSIPSHTEGCLLPGSSKATDYVGGSRAKLNEIRGYMKDKNMFNVRLNIFNVINRTTTR